MHLYLQVTMRLLGDEEDRAAAGRRRHCVLQQPLLDDEYARGADAAHELNESEMAEKKWYGGAGGWVVWG
jgi:hypothetical protein